MHNRVIATSNDLLNIFNGITDIKTNVTAESSDVIGRNIQDNLIGIFFKGETLLKSD